MALDGLPFDISELSWDKLNLVATHLNLETADASYLMSQVLGPCPADIWLHSFPKILLEFASVLLNATLKPSSIKGIYILFIP